MFHMQRRWFFIHAGLIFICISIRQRWFKFHFNLLGSDDFFLQFNLAGNVDFHLERWFLSFDCFSFAVLICYSQLWLLLIDIYLHFNLAHRSASSILDDFYLKLWLLFIRSRQQYYSAFSFDFNLHRRMHGLMFFFIILLRSDI